MSYKKVRNLAVLFLVAVVVFAAAVGVFNYLDQAAVAAHARATPQIPPEAAGSLPEPIDVSLPDEVNVATVALLRGRSDVVILDVRSPAEYADWHIPGAVSFPQGDLATQRVSEIPSDRKLVVMCRSGRRSARFVQELRAMGFTDVHDMLGGIRAWDTAGYEVEASPPPASVVP